MKLKDIFLLSLTSIQHRHLRSWLTILGIVIGVASIISLIGISLGISSSISARINTLGSNIIEVSPGGQVAGRVAGFGGAGGEGGAPGGGRFTGGGLGSSSQPEITFDQADDLKTLPGVEAVDARLQNNAKVQYKEMNISRTIIGADPSVFPLTVGVNISAGRYLSTSDQDSAVIGYNVANTTFNDLSMVNKQIKINGVTFKVVGILNSSGGSAFGSSDNDIFIPLRTAKNMFNQSTDASSLVIIASPDADPATVASEIENELIMLHHVTSTTEDFTITTAATIEATVASITGILSLLLGGIASISLLVGAIGVANTMFMSVLEQTKEIGVLKSLGAKNGDIVSLFLAEAAIIGFVGGALGVVLALITSSVLASFSVPMEITPELLVGGLLFSVVIGIVAGIIPARSAAAIPPVEALRYE